MSTQLRDSGSTAMAFGAEEQRQTAADQGLTSLVSGIVGDMQRLLTQHLDLFHQEIRDDFRKTKEAVLSIGMGGALAGVAALLALPALVGFLSWAIPAVPWWGWCGILAGTTAIAAGVLIWLGRKELASFNPLPDQSAQAVEENYRWISDRVTTDRP